MTQTRTTDTDRLDYLRFFLISLQAHRAAGDDLDDVIHRLERTVAKKERQAAT